jgi:uncharacterized protein DUF5069
MATVSANHAEVTMLIPRPQEQMAGCCWLPRFADKARLYHSGRLPFLYRLAFGSRLGVDGYFLRHFKLSLLDFIEGVTKAIDDHALAQWFLAHPGVTAQRIADWNLLAPKLGTRGCPGFLTRQVVKWMLYPKSIRQPVNSLFDAIEQDEGTGAFAKRNF